MDYIEVKDLVKKYKKYIAVNNISFSLDKGDVLGIIGENGAGKSTLMSMLVTLVRPTKGDIIYNEESIVNSPYKIRGHIGYVPQDITLYEELTAMDNIKFFAKTYHISKEELPNRIKIIKDIIGLEDNILQKKVKTYSGGMKRRVNIGIALLNDPEIIVMDEPTVGIDIASKDYILSVIKRLNKEGKTIIYTSHYLDEIEELCNKICIMNKGEIIEFSTLEDITSNKLKDKTFRQYYLDKSRQV